MYNTTLIPLPARESKPRVAGRTHTLDNGIGLQESADLLDVAAPFLDLVKIGWGTGLILGDLDERIALYGSRDVAVCLGGTLFELCYVHGRLNEFEELLSAHGLRHVEISDGTIEVDAQEKLELITRFSESFVVYSEVGSKDADAIVSPARWVDAIQAELDAGADKVILEGRESGTAGLYRGSGEIRMGLIDEILEAGIRAQDLVFEAPVKAQQVYLIRLLGSDVNFGNISPRDVLPLESLRLGIRSDTLPKFHGGGDR